MISRLRILVAASLAGAALSAASIAEESMIWNAKTSGGFVTNENDVDVVVTVFLVTAVVVDPGLRIFGLPQIR